MRPLLCTQKASMTGHGPSPAFVCTSCGSPSVRFPDEIHDAAALHCGGCGRAFGSWFGLKERARQVILSDIESGRIAAERASSDILINRLPPHRLLTMRGVRRGNGAP
jgi:hypothetical protein